MPAPTQERAAATSDRLLDATISLLASGGSQAVTHRAVAAAAGVAHGSTRYHFANRGELIRAAVRKLAEEDVAALRDGLEGLSADAAGPERIARSLSSLLAGRAERNSERELGRYELFLLASREPALRPDLDAWGESYRELFAPHLERLGSSDPETDAHLILSLSNALLLEQVAMRRKDFEEALLRPALTRLLTLAAEG